jgi:presenilin-like A22 family membrane protease
MKHSLPITAVLVLIFLASQLFGMYLIVKDAQVAVDVETGTITVGYSDTAIGERPEVKDSSALIFIIIGVSVSTAILLFIMTRKFGRQFWRVWYALAVWMTVAISLGVFIPFFLIVLGIAFALMLLKIFLPNPLIHNSVEVLMYSGIALLFAPMFGVLYASILLIAISIYDIIAVWKSKHMVKLAEFQASTKIFAGLLVPYDFKKFAKAKSLDISGKPGKKDARAAILGGGDVVFPLIFNGAIAQFLLTLGFSKLSTFLYALIPIGTVTLALILLFAYSRKGKFYPAMPFLSAGCFAGYGILRLILFLI